MARKISVEIVGDTRNLERSLARASSSATKFSLSFGQIAKGALAFGGVAAAINVVSGALRASISEFSDQQKAAAQTDAVIRSTGGAAGVTAKQVDKLAESISRYSGLDDEAVRAGENLLLTFPQITNAVGKGNKIFDQATVAATDLSVALGVDMKAAALQVGKALNDPARGYARLQRIGVAFSKTQVALIKRFSELGQKASAQKVILAELTKEFGGSARALGSTIPGQLNKLKETLRNVGGDLVGKLAPAFDKALTSANKFVAGLADAKGLRGKISFVVSGIQTLGRDLFRQIKDAISKVDFAGAVGDVQTGLINGLTRIAGTLDQIDWSRVGKAIGDGVVRGVTGAAAFLQSVDWGIVGNKIVQGIEKFLRAVNWKALFVGVFKLAVAAMKGAATLAFGIASEIGRGIGRALGEGLAALGGFVERKALEIVLRIAKALDFKVFGRSVIPGMSALVKRINGKLDELGDGAEKTALRVEKATDRISKAVFKAGNPGVRGTAASRDKETPVLPGVDPPAPAGTSRAKQNQFFDNRIARATTRIQDITTLKGQLTGLQKLAGLIQARINATKDITRRLNLEDKLLDVQRQARALRDQIAQGFIDSLQFNVDTAATTKGLGDDLRGLLKLQGALKDRVAAEGKTLELQQQLFAVRTKIAETRAAQRDRSQFKALGLDTSGNQPIPGVKGLQKQLGKVGDAVKGTFLDTNKTRSLLSSIRKVLAGGLGALSDEVRSKVAEMLTDIDQQLKNHSGSPLTKTTSLNANRILEGLGLGRDAEKKLRARLSGFNSAGMALASGGAVGSFGKPIALTSHTQINLDGRPVANVVTKHQEKRDRRNPPQTRGRNF